MGNKVGQALLAGSFIGPIAGVLLLAVAEALGADTSSVRDGLGLALWGIFVLMGALIALAIDSRQEALDQATYDTQRRAEFRAELDEKAGEVDRLRAELGDRQSLATPDDPGDTRENH